MKCNEAFFLVIRILNEPYFKAQKLADFEEHIKDCRKCADEYNENKAIISLLKKHGQISNDTLALIENAGNPYKTNMTVEKTWQNLLRRCPDLAQNIKRQKRFKSILHISAVAACLIIGVFTWSLSFNDSKSHLFLQNSFHRQVASALKFPMRIELISEEGNTPLSIGQQISSDGKAKTLKINGKHQIVMNSETSLSIEPLLKDNRTGCLVKLTSGEIYTHVEHDGQPFIVKTPYGQAAITGTTFDIKVIENSTLLAVTEGTVRFESAKGTVNVEAGHLSKIIKLAAPTEPIPYPVAEITAWATSINSSTAAKTEKSSNTLDLPYPITEKAKILENIHYPDWIEQNRDWFKQQFPWIFQLKDALATEGIKTDYPELLILSGDVWQFIWSESLPVKFCSFNFDSALKTASAYGLDKQWLLENVPIARYTIQNPLSSKDKIVGIKAFEQWLKCMSKPKPFAYIHSYYANEYLAETRSLIWFAVKGTNNLTDKKRSEILSLLQQEIAVAYKCRGYELYPADIFKSCDENKCHKSFNDIVESIKTIKVIEEEILTYQIDNLL